MWLFRVSFLVLFCFGNSLAISRREIHTQIQRAADEVAAKYDCGVSIAFTSEDRKLDVDVASGYRDSSKTHEITKHDRFIWGSVTKILTGVSILSLAHKDKFSLDDNIAHQVDPYFKELLKIPSDAKYMNYTSLEELFGHNISKTSIRSLAKMMSGIPDFDTAKGRGDLLVDPFRASLYKTPTMSPGPVQILSYPWVYTKKLNAYKDDYSSTNFLLLGMLLARYSGAKTWQDLRQIDLLPASVRKSLPSVTFAVNGTPADYTPVHGYDRTTYNGQNPKEPIDVSAISGVFAGWTASDLVATVSDAARLTHDIYGPSPKIIPAELVRTMVPKGNESWYGFATFNLTLRTGVKAPEGVAYGHLGSTYGYQSVVSFFPHYNFSLAVATNIETDYQTQPAEGLCKAFNYIRALIKREPAPVCRFVGVSSYYKSHCNCTVP